MYVTKNFSFRVINLFSAVAASNASEGPLLDVKTTMEFVGFCDRTKPLNPYFDWSTWIELCSGSLILHVICR